MKEIGFCFFPSELFAILFDKYAQSLIAIALTNFIHGFALPSKLNKNDLNSCVENNNI